MATHNIRIVFGAQYNDGRNIQEWNFFSLSAINDGGLNKKEIEKSFKRSKSSKLINGVVLIPIS